MEYIKLGDVATYVNGYAFKPKDRGNKGLPIIRIQDLTGNSYDLGFYNGIYPQKVEINNGDILISWSASLGVYIWNRGKALLNQHIFKVVFNKVDIDKNYFVYAVKHKLNEMIAKTHGATMKHIIKSDFDETEIPYPNINEQKRISKVLNKVEKIIALRNAELKTLDSLIKARFVEMFGNPVANEKGWNVDLCKNLTTKIGSGATPKGGKESYLTKGISLIRSLNVHNNQFVYDDLACISMEQAEKLNNVIIQQGDVLLNITGASVARCCIVPNSVLPARVNQHVSIIRCNEKLLPVFVSCMFTDDNFQQFLLNVATGGGATREAITKEEIEKFVLITPPIERQKKFVDFVEQIDKSKVAVQKALDEAQLLFDSLMQEYFG